MRLKGVDRVVTLVGVTESHAFTSTSSSSSSPSWKSLSPWSWSSSSSSSSVVGGASGVSRFHISISIITITTIMNIIVTMIMVIIIIIIIVTITFIIIIGWCLWSEWLSLTLSQAGKILCHWEPNFAQILSAWWPLSSSFQFHQFLLPENMNSPKEWTVDFRKVIFFCDYHHMCYTWFDKSNVEWPLPDEPNFPSHCYPLLVINQTVAILSKYAGVTIGPPQLFTCSHSWNMRVVTKTQQFLMNPWTLHHYWFVAKLISI